ncbi:alpha/beta hydrolase [Aquisphaera insulae]|uniref:alpha/beta hydrolase n=1 Tax=Aquisphaera insulae TaxID=2712864 RepID=UPI0013EA9174|nr:alpha/beta hydrolase [Aquisphaera insulae]
MRRRFTMQRLARLGVLAFSTLISIAGAAQVRKQMAPGKPRPDFADLSYGPHARNVLDFWKAPAVGAHPRPRPVVIFFHGGGFLGGNKSSVPAWLVDRCLAAGISVASANYRLSTQAPYPAPMLDGALAIQFLRSRAAELEIAPDRIAGCGNSAGGGIALWAGMHEDLADPASDDPVRRQSSRLACLGLVGAQTSYDPRFIKALVGGRAHEHVALRPLFGVATDAEADSSTAHRLYVDASPINHASPDDPPMILFYSEPNGPLPIDSRPGLGIHHPRFGAALKARMDPLGVECRLRHGDEYKDREHPEESMYEDLVRFFQDHLHP